MLIDLLNLNTVESPVAFQFIDHSPRTIQTNRSLLASCSVDRFVVVTGTLASLFETIELDVINACPKLLPR